MKKNTLREIGECLKSAPSDNASGDEVEAWLFKIQNSVAVRLDRILGDEAVRDVLSIAAGRTWRQVTRSNGKAKNLWRRLGDEIVPIVEARTKSLDAKVGVYPDGVLASLFAPKHTGRDIALICWGWCQKPLAVKADLIFPYHGGWGELPCDKAVWKWVKLSHADDYAVRFPPAGDIAKARPVPPIGDFVAPMVMNRLSMMVQLRHMLAIMADESNANGQADWLHAIVTQLGAVRKAIYDTPDSRERTGAMSLLQVYLASEKYRSGFEADWSVIPWPSKPKELTRFIYNQPEDAKLFKGLENVLWTWRNHGLNYTVDEALKKHPGEVVSIVKAGLEWLSKQSTSKNKGGRPGLSSAEKKRRIGLWEAWNDRAGVSKAVFLEDYNKKYKKKYTERDVDIAGRTYNRECGGD